ncbi:site-specific DNA-methyltransferase [Larkinella sp. VNQ87]|uniref:site-specific DNA-methyltransferase n=1 Tax=Larkinella sp. VNQ87 TaxID=3400921 RepID=UPI003C044829
MAKKTTDKIIAAFTHDEAKRRNIPTAEYQSMLNGSATDPIKVAYERRNRDLDPQLVWRGKEEQDWSDLMVQAPPLYIQEKVQPKALIDDLLRQSKEQEYAAGKIVADLFSDFNGIPKGVDKTEFYQHDQHWSNRMILGDSLQVMASLCEREGLRGKVQCIYFDPPYGIKFNSNFQWSTMSRDVKDGKIDQITREPEQVKAFRDTWRDGIHSYMTYLRDRLTVARDLLADSGSIFVQIGDENVHRVRAIMDEVFGDENFIATIHFNKTGLQASKFLSSAYDYILWFSKSKENAKFHQIYRKKVAGEAGATGYTYVQEEVGLIRGLTKEEKQNIKMLPETAKVLDGTPLVSAGSSQDQSPINWQGKDYRLPANSHWKTTRYGIERLVKADRIIQLGNRIEYKMFLNDFGQTPIDNFWMSGGERGFTGQKVYVVQTATDVIERCILMATDPGDLVLDPTCGSGTTAFVAEQWGRRWITIDTSRVALALARARIMGGRYPYYLLADSQEGQLKEAEITRTTPSTQPTRGNLRLGFVYDRVPHITLKSIANNSEIDEIWNKWQATLEPLRTALNTKLGKEWAEWEISPKSDAKWSNDVLQLHKKWWEARIARQIEIDASIAAKAEFEYLYDKPYEDKRKVRVAGPFTVESLSPHRMLGVDENDELIDPLAVQENKMGYGLERTFEQMILENLKSAGVQQAHKADKIDFTALTGWPGELICAEGTYLEGEKERRAGIFIGPEFGTVQRADLVKAARECGDAGFDVLIACAFNYEAHATEFSKLGSIPVLKARMNADLHMSDDLKNTGKGNLFVIFGEPDIDVLQAESENIQVKLNGVDVFHPNTGEVRSDGAEGIACWFIDTDYNEESFFVRHAYFLGANNPYKALKTTLKAEINQEVWESLNSDISRPFPKPASGRIAVKVINHLGDEVMKVFKVS